MYKLHLPENRRICLFTHRASTALKKKTIQASTARGSLESQLKTQRTTLQTRSIRNDLLYLLRAPNRRSLDAQLLSVLYRHLVPKLFQSKEREETEAKDRSAPHYVLRLILRSYVGRGSRPCSLAICTGEAALGRETLRLEYVPGEVPTVRLPCVPRHRPARRGLLRPLEWRNVVVAHGAADPNRPLSRQQGARGVPVFAQQGARGVYTARRNAYFRHRWTTSLPVRLPRCTRPLPQVLRMTKGPKKAIPNYFASTAPLYAMRSAGSTSSFHHMHAREGSSKRDATAYLLSYVVGRAFVTRHMIRAVSASRKKQRTHQSPYYLGQSLLSGSCS